MVSSASTMSVRSWVITNRPPIPPSRSRQGVTSRRTQGVIPFGSVSRARRARMVWPFSAASR